MKRPSVARQQSNRPKRKHDAGTVDVDSSELNSVEQSLSVNEAPSTSPSASFVSQLDTLRSFLSGSEVAYNEAELSQCLRQSGYNVQRAAERLITGQFKGRCSGSNPSKSFLLKDSRTSPDTTNGGEVLSGHCPKAAASATKNGRASPESASEPTPTKRTDDQSYVAGSMLLCTRWIIGCSTSRNGRMKHNEVMQLSTSQSGPPVVRLRGNSIEGTLPSNIGAILSPLMRSVIKVEEDGLVEPAVENQPLIFVTGQALMDDFGLSIGKDVPIAVSVYIQSVETFFNLFSSEPLSSSSSQTFKQEWRREGGGRFGSLKQINNKVGLVDYSLAEAAFNLLQWAQYGEAIPKFHRPDEDSSSDKVTDENISLEEAGVVISEQTRNEGQAEVDDDDSDGDNELNILDEEEFNAEAETVDSDGATQDNLSLARSVFDQEVEGEGPATGAEINILKKNADHSSVLHETDDPKGLQNGIVLRNYQRQALHWMMERETNANDRENVSKELKLLVELLKEEKSSTSWDSHSSTTNTASCSMEMSGESIQCTCGPVVVSQEEVAKSRTIDGVVNPVHHPLWQCRFLTNPSMNYTICFYVNELFRVSSATPPNPPKQCVGGILADAMGLGKTVMLLSLILKTQERSEEAGADIDVDSKKGRGELTGTTLIVTPLSLLTQWEEEIRTKTNLSHYIYYGTSSSRKLCEGEEPFRSPNVVLTTYGTLQGEFLAQRKQKEQKPSPLHKAGESPLLQMEWFRVILDEAHCIKNPATAISKACTLLNAERRWCVTGTPIQNSLLDVYGLVKFLRHEPWCEMNFWKRAIDEIPSSASGTSMDSVGVVKPVCRDEHHHDGGDIKDDLKVAVVRVKRMLSSLILRRTKSSLGIDGRSILSLPPVDSRVVCVAFSLAEREFYDALYDKSQCVFDGFLKAGTASKSWFAIFSLLHRLRQTCDHVALTVQSRMKSDDLKTDESMGDKSASDCDTAQRCGVDDSTSAITGGDKHITDQFLQRLLASFRAQQTSNINRDNADQEDIPQFPTTFNAFTYAAQIAETLTQSIESKATYLADECPICLELPSIESSVLTPCAHMFCKECILSVLKDKGIMRGKAGITSESTAGGPCPVCSEWVSIGNIVPVKMSEGGDVATDIATVTKRGDVKLSRNNSFLKVGRSAARQALEESFLGGASSAKLKAVMEELDKVWEADRQSKILIFSQYLGFLDILESALTKENIVFDRLDGKMSLKERMVVLQKFNRMDPAHSTENMIMATGVQRGPVLLLSMKAGGVGLNLVAASSVFIVDPWWNAATEDQCINRIHRIGQTAEIVRVRKFVVQDSVEEKIVAMQKRKKDMAGEVLGSSRMGGIISVFKPTLDDFKILLGR